MGVSRRMTGIVTATRRPQGGHYEPLKPSHAPGAARRLPACRPPSPNPCSPYHPSSTLLNHRHKQHNQTQNKRGGGENGDVY